MYRTIRTVHLCTAMMVLPFLLLYVGSAIQLAHRTWAPISQSVVRSSATMDAGLTDAREAARILMRRGAVRGEVAGIQENAGTLRLRVVRPGASSQVVYSETTGMAEIETATANFSGFANRLHTLHGVWHEEAALNAWASALALLSCALLAMGGTGLYLWFQNHGERRTGAVLLACGTVLTLGLMVSMRW